MSWLELRITADKNQVDHYSEILLNAGALALSLEDAAHTPLFEPPLHTTPWWEKTQLIALWNADLDTLGLQTLLRSELDPETFKSLRIEPLEDKDWTRAWIEHFQPMHFGESLSIYPSWCDTNGSSRTTISLDPGLAFGTGTHPTTRLCLEWLDAQPPMQAQVLDYGCGSGILGIAALKLGASKVFAVDHDPQALLSTQSNAQKNGFSEREILTLLPDALALPLPGTVDLLLANILADPLIALAPLFAEFVRPGGTIILSGLLETQLEPVFAAYAPWFEKIDSALHEGWGRLSASRREGWLEKA
jgi:ribosomal protein L11 methyltransferase